MTKNAKSLTPSVEAANESLDEFIERNQIEFIQFLTRQRLARNLDEVNLKRLVSEVCEGESWDEACDHFSDMWGKAYDAIKENMVKTIQNRMILGAEKIEEETDATQKRLYTMLYTSLENKLRELMAR